MNNISSKLENLAAVASISPKRLKQSIPSEWVPSRNGPGLPNLEYTKTREERWATLSILVARIICDYTINPDDIRQLAKMFTDTTDTADTKTDTKKKNNKNIPPREVNDVIRYVRQQMKEIENRKRPTATKIALIAEYFSMSEDNEKVVAMAKQLQPSRYGWLLTGDD